MNKLLNRTDIDSKLIHKFITYACTRWRQLTIGDWQKIPKHKQKTFNKSYLNDFTVKEIEKGYSGVCKYDREIICRIGKIWWNGWCDVGINREKSGGYRELKLFEREFLLCGLIAHEVGHAAIFHNEKYAGRKFSRKYGETSGGDEEYIDRIGFKIAKEFYNKNKHPNISQENLAELQSKFDVPLLRHP